MKNNRPVRFLIYSIYLAMTCSGLVFLAAGLRGEAPWAGCGMLLALRFENVKLGSRQQSALVAFAPEGLGKGQMYQALTGGAL